MYQAPDLLKLHIQTLYKLTANGRLLSTNEPNPQPAPRFLLGRSTNATIYHFRHDLPQPLIDQLTNLAQSEPISKPLAPKPKYAKQYQELLQSHDPIQKIHSGPAYRIPIPQPPQPQAIAITPQNVYLCQDTFNWLCEEIDLEQPCLAIVIDGRAISICRSVRIGQQAHEAGIETHSDYRGQGYAPIVASGWATAVHELGRIPLYSTSWQNIASQKVAEKLNMEMYGATFHIT